MKIDTTITCLSMTVHVCEMKLQVSRIESGRVTAELLPPTLIDHVSWRLTGGVDA